MDKSYISEKLTKNDQQVSISPSLAEISLKYRGKVDEGECQVITSPQEAEKVLRKVWDKDAIQLREEFVILLLNNAKKMSRMVQN